MICKLSYYEAFGLTPPERMSCGCIPVVTEDRTGMSEFVGNIGFYTAFGDKKETAEAIKKALKAPNCKSEESREIIVERFSIKNREKNLVKIIQDLMN